MYVNSTVNTRQPKIVTNVNTLIRKAIIQMRLLHVTLLLVACALPVLSRYGQSDPAPTGTPAAKSSFWLVNEHGWVDDGEFRK
jgi:hypothetical protein